MWCETEAKMKVFFSNRSGEYSRFKKGLCKSHPGGIGNGTYTISRFHSPERRRSFRTWSRKIACLMHKRRRICFFSKAYWAFICEKFPECAETPRNLHVRRLRRLSYASFLNAAKLSHARSFSHLMNVSFFKCSKSLTFVPPTNVGQCFTCERSRDTMKSLESLYIGNSSAHLLL